MSHIVNPTVKDGDDLVKRNDPDAEATAGSLEHSKDPYGKATPSISNAHHGTMVHDEMAIDLLQKILLELRIMNAYNAVCHENVITEQDVSNGEE